MGERLYFDEIRVGMRAESRAYTVTEAEIIEIARKWDPRPIHLDRRAAVAAGFPDLIASASLTMLIRYRLYNEIERHICEFAAIMGLGAEYRLPGPLVVNDRVRLVREVVAVRASASRPHAGVVTTHCRLVERSGRVIFDEPRGAVLIERRVDGARREEVRVVD